MNEKILTIINNLSSRFLKQDITTLTKTSFNYRLAKLLEWKTNSNEKNEECLSFYKELIFILAKEKDEYWNKILTKEAVYVFEEVLKIDWTYEKLQKLHMDIKVFLSMAIKWELVDFEKNWDVFSLNNLIYDLAVFLITFIRNNTFNKEDDFLKKHNIPEKLFIDFIQEYKKYMSDF